MHVGAIYRELLKLHSFGGVSESGQQDNPPGMEGNAVTARAVRLLPSAPAELIAAVRSQSHPLSSPSDLDPLLERIGHARYVLLGEASHGTHEYYTWRASISRRLIEEKGFSFIAVEGDWPDCYRVNRYIKGYPDSGESAREVLHAFERCQPGCGPTKRSWN